MTAVTVLAVTGHTDASVLGVLGTVFLQGMTYVTTVSVESKVNGHMTSLINAAIPATEPTPPEVAS